MFDRVMGIVGWTLFVAGIAFIVWVIATTMAHADVVKESDGVHWWPGRGRVGPERCGTANTRQGGHADGTWAYFYDVGEGCPMACDGTPTTDGSGSGAFCVHEHGVWNCGLCAGHPNTCACPPGTVQTGTNPDGSPFCQAFCVLLGGACTVDADCCSGLCIGGVCTGPCHPAGAMCSVAADCCSDACVDGVCGIPCCPNPCTNGGICVPGCGGTICICPPGFCGDLCQTPCATTTSTSSSTIPTSTSTSTSLTPTTTSTSTTGATPTTTSTSTTIAPGLSVTILWVPTWPLDTGEAVRPGTGDNVMHCNAWVPDIGIQDVTAIVFNAANGPWSGGVAIYNADGSSRIATTGGVNMNGGSTVFLTPSSAFTILPGTKYQVCSCFTSTPLYTVLEPGPTGDSALIQNPAFPSVNLSTTAANLCTAGSPPLTTGALTAESARSPILLLLGTNTP